MRAFSFHPGEGAPLRRTVSRSLRSGETSPTVRASFLFVVVFLLWGAPLELGAQWPPEIRGRVVDAVSGDPVSGARVLVEGAGRAVETDGRGRFHLRGLEPGTVVLAITALGYGEAEKDVVLENGRVSRPEVSLTPRALPVPGIRATARPGAGGARVLDREAVAASGARTVGELLSGMPGVTVRGRGPGGRETLTIRGEDAVLVLLDGAPLNDPLTGEADLSEIPAPALERVTVLPGARSTRYGPGAQGGVVLLESRREGSGPEVAGRAGSLGLRSGEARVGGDVGSGRLSAGVEYEQLDGSFRFRRSEDVGGGAGLRGNADLQRMGARGAAELGLFGGRLHVAGGYRELERGLPGKSFAPSDSARERRRRSRATVSWHGDGDGVSGAVAGYGVYHRFRVRDPAPPLGPPFDDRTRMNELGLRVHVDARPEWGVPVSLVAAGLDVARRAVRSTSLSLNGPARRSDLGFWIRGEAALGDGEDPPMLSGAVRAHRAGPSGVWRASHEVTLRGDVGPVTLHAAHRSAFNPPTLGDQFFREGVAVRPNPDLGAERVPGEVELGLSHARRVGPVHLDLSATAFAGDVRDMIVWAPDFRFVWSPRNVDVERSGLELRGDLALAGTGFRLRSAFTRARVVYDRDGSRDVQLRYRPRHTGTVTASWARTGFRAEATARFVGRRTTVPANVNVLPAFWTVDLDLGKRWAWSGWTLYTAARVNRVLDRTDPFIFAFPEPGRTVALELRVGPPTP